MQVEAVEFNIPSSATVNLNTATLNSPGTITVASSGTLQVSTGTITVSNNGNWANSGTLTPGSSVVQFTGTSHTISGSSTFYNLKCEIPGGTINFEASQRQTISNTLTLTGATGNRLNLRSSSDGTQWEIDPQGTRNVDFLDIKDAKNVNSTAISVNNSTNSGNNTNWTINGVSTEAVPVPEPGPTPFVLLVTSRSPSSGATGISITTTINATFNDNINGSTVATNTFMVSGGGATVAGAVSTNGSAITFTPSGNLANNTTYTATITTGVQAANAAGTSLSSDSSWSFTTVSAGVSTPTPTPAPTPTAVVTPTQTPTPIPTPTFTPTPTPTPTPTGGLFLSKHIAYLSGDTIVATLIDADRNTGLNSADTLTTAMKVTGSNNSIGTDLLLDLKEDGVNSGTFLATFKTGTTTVGGASSSVRANSGTIKAIQGGTATVMYFDTTPNASTITKTISLSSFDATLVFDADTYSVGSYAGMTLADAERNANHTEAESLLNDVFIETSSFNITRARMIETGADTGTFVGSIQVAASGGTLEFERIQAAVGDTLKITYIDEINTTGFTRIVTDTASVKTAVTPTPTPTATATPIPCEPESISADPAKSLTLLREAEGEVAVTVSGDDGDCQAAGVTVTATTTTAGAKRISISPASDTTDANGEVVFTMTAKDKKGNARVTFKADGVKKPLRYTVKVKKK